MNRRTAAAMGVLLVLCVVEFAHWKLQIIEPAHREHFASDLFKEHYPTFHAGFGALREGRLALWNPYQLMGSSFLAVPYTGLLYPGNLAYLLTPTAVAIELTQFSHLVFGAMCMSMLLRALGMGWWAGLAGALGVMLSGMMNEQSLYPVLVQGMTWLPASVLAVERTLRGGRFAPLALAVVVALQILNGSTEFMIYNLYAAGLYALFDLVPRLARGEASGVIRAGVMLLVAILLGAGLAGVQLLPSLELVSMSGRSGGVDIYLAKLWGTIPPHFFLAESLRTAGPVAIGVLPLAAGLLGLASTRYRGLWLYAVVLGTASALLVFGGTIFELYFQTPIGSVFRRPAKFLHLYAFAGALLAAIAVEQLESWRKQAIEAPALFRRPSWLAALAGCLLVTAWLGIAEVTLNPHLLASFALLLVFGLVPRSEVRVAAIAMLVAIHGADLFTASKNQDARPYTTVEPLHRHADLFDDLAKRRETGRIYVSPIFNSVESLGFKQGTLREIPVVMDLQPLVTGRHDDFFSVAAGPNLRSRGFMPLSAEHPWQLLDLASTRFYVLRTGEPFELHMAELARRPEETGLRRIHGTRVLQVYERTGWLPRAYVVNRARNVGEPEEVLEVIAAESFDPRAEVLLESGAGEGGGASGEAAAASRDVGIVVDEPERVVIEVGEGSAPGYLVLTDSHYPGWQARVDGEPSEISRANYLFRAVPIGAAASRVAFEYRPGSLRAGLWLGGVSALLLAGMTFVRNASES